MLLKIRVEVGAVGKWVDSMSPAEATREQRRFCKYLLKHGALYFRSEADHARFIDELRHAGTQGSQIAHLWAESRNALKDARWRIAPEPIDLDLAPPTARIRTGSPERVRINRYTASEACERIEDLNASGLVPARSSREDVWRRWLAPLVEHYRDIAIYDPYLGRQFAEGGPQASVNGVAACLWLLQRIGETTARHRVTLMTLSMTGQDQDVRDICAAALSHLGRTDRGRGLEQVSVVAAARSGARGAHARARAKHRDLHDRHIRFSGGSSTEVALVVPAGIDRLGRDPLDRDLHLQYRPEFKAEQEYSIADLREKEDAVLEAAPNCRADLWPA
jgi:hypothetical protein